MCVCMKKYKVNYIKFVTFSINCHNNHVNNVVHYYDCRFKVKKMDKKKIYFFY